MLRPRRFTGAALCLTVAAVATTPTARSEDWPSFRGPGASGLAPSGATLPETWDVAARDSVKWKTHIPGLAHASPIVSEDAVFIVTAVKGEDDDALRVGLYGDIESVEDHSVHEWKLYRLEETTGKIVWERTVHRGVPKVKRHPKSTHASSTPATDGKHVVVLLGSEGLYAYSVDGELLWKTDLGLLDSGFYRVPTAQWGFGSSPVIHGGRVFVQADVQEGSFVAAFDVATGEEIWRTPRSDVPTWSTPTVHASEEGALVLVNGWKHMGAYDAATGREIWKLAGGGDIPVPTPVVHDGLVFLTNAHGDLSPIYAVRLDARGDVSLGQGASANEAILWSVPRGGNYMQTPLVYEGLLYAARDNGVLSCFRARTGELLYRERLGPGASGFSASPVAGDGKIYFTSEEGDVHVVKAGPKFELLAVNPLDETAMASPAISGDTLLFRTRRHVVAISGPGR